jgi:hypothetical protein
MVLPYIKNKHMIIHRHKRKNERLQKIENNLDRKSAGSKRVNFFNFLTSHVRFHTALATR